MSLLASTYVYTTDYITLAYAYANLLSLSANTRFLDYGIQASRFETVPFDPLSPDPVAVFEIFYRSKSSSYDV